MEIDDPMEIDIDDADNGQVTAMIDQLRQQRTGELPSPTQSQWVMLNYECGKSTR